MTTRFRVDLLHPGWVAQTWQEWFIGPRGVRRLALFTLAGIAALLVVLVAVIMPAYWRMSSNLNALPGLRRDLAARDTDLALLRSNLQGLTEEARRQVRWAELLTTFSQQIPATLRLQLVEGMRAAPPGSGQQAAASARAESTLRLDAITPLRPGSPPLLEVAQFMAGLMRDPAVNRRFQLKSWEIKPGTAPGPEGVQMLNIGIVLTERAQ
jgi:hypothetical protein